MKLEDEIKTKAFRSERHKLTVNLIYTYSWLVNRNGKVFKRFGLTLQQYNILRILRGQFPNMCNIQLLKERMLDKQPDVSRLIDRLHQKGLIERTTSATDRRKLDLLISASGLALLAEIDPVVEAMEEGFESLTSEEIQTVNELLDRLRDSK